MHQVRHETGMERAITMEIENPVIEALAKRERSAWHAPRIGTYHASQLPYCLLKQWYGFQEDVKEEVTGQSQASMYFGSQFHWAMENVILPNVEKAFRVVAVEQPVHHLVHASGEEILMVGQFDALIQKPNGRYAILENKTTKTTMYVEREGIPQIHHQLQSSLYMRATNIPRTVYQYWGWFQMAPIFLEAPYNPEHFKTIRDTAIKLHSHLIHGEAPDPDPQYRWECGSPDPDKYGCGYRSICPLSEAEKQAGQALSKETKQRMIR